MINDWFIHFYREFGEWLQGTITPIKLEKCDECNRLSMSHQERFNKQYCRKMNIPFRCGSCMFPQYEDTLHTSIRGNHDRIYGKRFNPKINNWVAIR